MKLDLRSIFNITAVYCKYEQSIFGKDSSINIGQRTKAFADLMIFNLRSGKHEDFVSESGETVTTYQNRSNVWALDHIKGFINLVNGEKPDFTCESANKIQLTDAEYHREIKILENSLCDYDLTVKQNSSNNVEIGDAFIEKFMEINKQAEAIKQSITENYVYQAISYLTNGYPILATVLGLGTKEDFRRSGFSVEVKNTSGELLMFTIQVTERSSGSVAKIVHSVNDNELHCFSDAELTINCEHTLVDFNYDCTDVIASRSGYQIEVDGPNEYRNKVNAIMLNTDIRNIATKLIEREMPPSASKLVEHDSLPRWRHYYSLIKDSSIAVGTSYFLKDVERMESYVAPEHSFLYQLNNLIERKEVDSASFAFELVKNGFDLEKNIKESFISLINRAEEQNPDNESLCLEQQKMAEVIINSVKGSELYEVYTSLTLANSLESAIDEIEGLSNTLARDYDISTTMTL